VLEVKRQFFHRARLHLKVPGCLSGLNALLTRNLPMFLLRLNEISAGRGNMFSFGIIGENFEVFKNDIVVRKVLRKVGEGGGHG